MGSCCSAANDHDVAPKMKLQQEMKESKDASLVDDGDVGEKITRQFIHEMFTKIFGSGPFNSNYYKLIIRGNIGPLNVNWDDNLSGGGDLDIARFCSDQPMFGEAAYFSTGLALPNGYAIALNALPIPQLNSPDYKKIVEQMNETLKKQDSSANVMKNEFAEYVNNSIQNKMTPQYTSWQTFAQNETPGQWEQYQTLMEDYQNEKSIKKKIVEQFDGQNPVVKANKKWDKFSTDTDNGTRTREAYWGTSNQIGVIIAQWKNESYSGGGSFTVTNNSSSYEQLVVDAKFKGLFDTFKIGIGGGVNQVFKKNSTYELHVSWKASATTTFTPPSAYDLALIKDRRNKPRDGYEGNIPLTGTENAPIQGIVTSAVTMFGLTIEATFDENTYKSIKQEADVGVVSFGLFGIGVHQSYTKTQYNDASSSFTAVGNTNQAFVVAVTVNPLE